MEKVKIKNIFDFQKKSKIKAGDGFKLGEAQYPFYTSSNELTKSINEYLFEDESLIFGTGGLASIHFCNEKFAVSTDCFVIQPKDKKRVFSKFVYYYLSGNMNILENGFKGAGLKHISKDYLENIEIPLPNLATQQRIAAILDQADAIIQNNRAIVQKYDALTQSLFLDMFGDPVKNEKGWEKVKGSLIYQVKGRVGWKGYKKTDLRESGAYVIGATHIDKFGYINLTNPVYISDEKFLESPEIIIEKNDLIFVQRGNTIGKIGLVRDVLERATINPVVVILRPKVSPYFLLYLLLNKSILNKIIEINSGSAQPMITQNSMNEYQFINPPIELQNQFAERVAVIEAQKQKAQLELAKSEELFNSLLQRAFKGGVELMGK